MQPDTNIDPKILTALGKVIIAIAWADGEIQEEEVDCISELLETLPDLPPEDLQVLKDFLEKPVEPTERDVIIDELATLITNIHDRNYALYWLDRMLTSKGRTDESEQAIYEEVVGRFLVRREAHSSNRATSTRMLANSVAFNPDLITYLNDKVGAYGCIDDLSARSDLELRKLALLGVIMARISRADNRIQESEVVEIRSFLMDYMEMSEGVAQEVSRIMLCHHLDNDTDMVHVCRELANLAEPGDRIKWLKILFKISSDDEGLEESELHQLVNICALLDISQDCFEDALEEFAYPS